MGHPSRNRKPYTYIITLSILLVLLLLFGLLYPTSRGDVTDHIQFLVDMGGGSQLIRPTLEKDGSLICALPGNAAPEAITWHPDGDVLLNGTAVRTGDPVNAADGTLTYDGTDYPIRFFRGSTLPAMYIRTRTGNLKKIHQNKYNEEKAAVTLYREDGTLDCNTSRFDSKLRGHGNSTWYFPKRSYNISFSRKQDLLDMGGAKKWALIANYLDDSNLRNDLIYRLARETGECWNPQDRYVDLYINGEYRGLYLLTERVEAAPGRVEVPDGGVLLNLELASRAKDFSIRDLFTGVSAEICWPKNLPDSDYAALDRQIRDIRDTVLSGEADEAYLREHLDLESWAWKYLIEEISMNYDTGACSQYAVYADGKLTSAAAWDYDNILGLTGHLSPNCFLAQREWKNDITRTPWFRGLWQYPVFSDLVKEMYSTRFLPLLHRLAEQDLPTAAAAISDSAHMDEVRWPPHLSRQSVDCGTEKLQDFLTRRIDFLTGAWVEGKQYHTVMLDVGRHYICDIEEFEYLYYAVEDGQPFTELPDPQALSLSDFSGWYNAATGEAYDPNAPVTEDLFLMTHPPKADTGKTSSGSHRRIPAFFRDRVNFRVLVLCFSLALLGVILYLTDRRRRTRP